MIEETEIELEKAETTLLGHIAAIVELSGNGITAAFFENAKTALDAVCTVLGITPADQKIRFTERICLPFLRSPRHRQNGNRAAACAKNKTWVYAGKYFRNKKQMVRGK
jgi:hypothetical protein